jgi:hypothetical protein
LWNDNNYAPYSLAEPQRSIERFPEPKRSIERFQPYSAQRQVEDQDSSQSCKHNQNCPMCRSDIKRAVDKRLEEHWATKWLELKKDAFEFLGLFLMGLFIITLVDLLLNTTR